MAEQRYRRTAQRSATPLVIVIIVLSCLLVACGVLLVLAMRQDSPTPAPTPATSGIGPSTAAPPETTPDQATTTPDPSGSDTAPQDTTTEKPDPENPKDVEWTTVKMPVANVHLGNLILVNYEHEYTFPTVQMITFYGNKTAPYLLRSSSVSVTAETLRAFNETMQAFYDKTKNAEILVVSGFRDYEAQQTVYADYVDRNGIAAAEKYVAMPGYSEHHTGLCIDLARYADEKTYDLGSSAFYPDFLREATAHGFVRRYISAKYEYTHITNEDWHFRYVGVPHAYYMNAKSLCLEEYIRTLSGYPFDGEHLCFSDEDGRNWDIYYVSADSAKTGSDPDSIALPVPKNLPYTVSGNNIDGFIVTVQR